MNKKKIIDSIRICNASLEAGEGVDLLYYMDNHGDEEAYKIINKILYGDTPNDKKN